MRPFNIVIAVLGWSLLAVISRAHDTVPCPDVPRNKLEAFEAQTGKVIVKGGAAIGTAPGTTGTVSVRCRELTDASTGLKEHGIAIHVRESEHQDDTTTIDYDELDSFLKGIDYLSKVDFSETSLNRFEAAYTTRAGLRIVVAGNNRTGNIEAAVHSTRYSKATAVLSMSQLAQFRVLVEQAKSKLDSVRSGR